MKEKLKLTLFTMCFPLWVFSQCWNPTPGSNMTQLNLMNIPPCWDITEGSEDVVVLVYDTYLDDQHCDLEDKVVEIIEPNNNCDTDDGQPGSNTGASWNTIIWSSSGNT